MFYYFVGNFFEFKKKLVFGTLIQSRRSGFTPSLSLIIFLCSVMVWSLDVTSK